MTGKSFPVNLSMLNLTITLNIPRRKLEHHATPGRTEVKLKSERLQLQGN